MGILKRICRRLLRKKRYTRIVEIDDKPSPPRKDTIYRVGDPYPWSLVFICPCGCENEVELNVLPDIKPCWKYSICSGNLISIYPSVWLSNDCGAHFSIRESRIKWHG